MKNAKCYIILLVFAGVLTTLIWRKVDALEQLREEQARLQGDLADQTRLAELNASHKATPPVDLAKLKRDADSVPSLKEQNEQLKETLTRLSALPPPAASISPDYTALWKNVGQLTPLNALHSIVWASLNGDADALVAMLAFDSESREAAEALWAGLPPAQRVQYSTAEKLFATLLAGRISPGLYQAEKKTETQEQPDIMRVRFVLKNATANGMNGKFVSLRFQRQGPDWRLMVPKSAVTEFQQELQAK